MISILLQLCLIEMRHYEERPRNAPHDVEFSRAWDKRCEPIYQWRDELNKKKEQLDKKERELDEIVEQIKKINKALDENQKLQWRVDAKIMAVSLRIFQ